MTSVTFALWSRIAPLTCLRRFPTAKARRSCGKRWWLPTRERSSKPSTCPYYPTGTRSYPPGISCRSGAPADRLEESVPVLATSLTRDGAAAVSCNWLVLAMWSDAGEVTGAFPASQAETHADATCRGILPGCVFPAVFGTLNNTSPPNARKRHSASNTTLPSSSGRSAHSCGKSKIWISKRSGSLQKNRLLPKHPKDGRLRVAQRRGRFLECRGGSASTSASPDGNSSADTDDLLCAGGHG